MGNFGGSMRDLVIPATDGFSLTATHFEAAEASKQRRTVVINAALGVPRQYYRAFAEFLSERGLDVVTFDVRGNGQSRPASLKGFSARMSDWSSLDAAGVLHWAKESWPDNKLMVVGHSSGGQTLGLAAGLDTVDGFVAVAAIGGHDGHWRGLKYLPKRLILRFMWLAMMPGLARLLGYYPGKRLGLADLPKGVALQWSDWCRHPDYVFSDASLDHSGYGHLAAPVLAYSFTDDTYVSSDFHKSVVGRYTNADITWRNLSPADVGLKAIGHFGFFKEPLRDNLWTETADWLAEI
jgi:predicted alpha/beta hydrolase